MHLQLIILYNFNNLFLSSKILLLVSFLNSLLASINSTLFSVLFLDMTSTQVAIEVPKNKLSGSCITQSIKLVSYKFSGPVSDSQNH